MKKFDRFDFEQQIMQCWHVTDDIRTVTEYLLDAPLEVDREDKIANMLLGIEALYEAKFDKLFRQFEVLIQENAAHLDRDYLGTTDRPWTDEQLNRVAVDLEELVNGINEENLQQEMKF